MSANDPVNNPALNPQAPGGTVEGGQPHMAPGSTVEGGQPHMAPGTEAEGGQPHMSPGTDAEGGQPHMSSDGGTPAWTAPGNPDLGAAGGGTPTWVAPGPPDHGASVGIIVGIVLLLLLLVGGGGVVAAKAGVFGCQFAAGGPATTSSALRMTGDSCGANGAGSSVATSTTTGREQATATVAATATATATATPRPTVAPHPTVTPKPTVVIPVPTISVIQPANNATLTTSDGADTFSGPITFRANTTSGSGASSVTVIWSDSVDGTLGTGAPLGYPKGLSSKHNTNCGASTAHTITATAKNNLGGVASASITVTVTPFCHS